MTKTKNLLHTAEITFNSKFYPCTAVIPYKIDHNLYNRLCGKCVIFQSEFCQYNRYTAAYNSCGNHTKSDTHELFLSLKVRSAPYSLSKKQRHRKQAPYRYVHAVAVKFRQRHRKIAKIIESPTATYKLKVNIFDTS